MNIVAPTTALMTASMAAAQAKARGVVFPAWYEYFLYAMLGLVALGLLGAIWDMISWRKR